MIMFRALFNTLSDKGVAKEFFEQFYEDYLTPKWGDYSNFSIRSGTVKLITVLFGLTIGFNIAALSTIFNKRYLGDFVRKVLDEEALSPETAKTIEELGYMKNTVIRSSLKSGVNLRRVVKCVEEEEYYKENGGKFVKSYKIDFTKDRFYIPEKDKYMADIKFEKKGTNWLGFLFMFVISFALMFAVIWLLPDLLQMADNFLSMLKGN